MAALAYQAGSLTWPRCPITSPNVSGSESEPGRPELVETGDLAAPYRCTLRIDDADVLRELVGELGAHLKLVGRALELRVQQRGDSLLFAGGADNVRAGARVMSELGRVVQTGYHLHTNDVDQACRLVREDPGLGIAELWSDTLSLGVGKKRVHPRTVRQRRYLQAMIRSDLVFGIGPAGTGKTYLAMAAALSALYRDDCKRIILCRPAVEAGEKLGFLPGDLIEKVNPYLRPLYDALNDLTGLERAGRLIERGTIEVAPLAFMRGRTLSGAFVILDEAQNTTREQMKMFLTRLGSDSQAVVTGDVTQVDLPRGQQSGLIHALRVLDGIDAIGSVHFTDADVVRHPLVSAIIRAYDADAAAAAAHRRGANGVR